MGPSPTESGLALSPKGTLDSEFAYILSQFQVKELGEELPRGRDTQVPRASSSLWGGQNCLAASEGQTNRREGRTMRNQNHGNWPRNTQKWQKGLRGLGGAPWGLSLICPSYSSG